MASVINLASKYSDKIVSKFTHSSYIAGNVSNEFEFAGVKSLTVYTPQPVELNTYNRTASANRFGTPTEIGDTIQEMTMTQEPSFSATIDNANYNDQMMTKKAGKMLKMQLDERMTPFVDSYAFEKFVNKAGNIVAVSAAPSKSNIVGFIADAAATLDNALVPGENRFLYIGSTNYNLLRMSDEFLAVDNLATKVLTKGLVGEIFDMKVIKVPDSLLPTNCVFLITYKDSVLVPFKLKTTRVLKDVPGIDGALLEGHYYFDAFVLGAKADGVYAAVKNGEVQATPTITISTNSATVTSSGATNIYYTTDGTDPRYSPTALTYTAAVSLTSGQTIKAYAVKTGKFPSAVASATNS